MLRSRYKKKEANILFELSCSDHRQVLHLCENFLELALCVLQLFIYNTVVLVNL